MKWQNDPIVEDVWQVREEILEEAGGLNEYFDILKRNEKKHPERLVTKEQMNDSKKKAKNE